MWLILALALKAAMPLLAALSASQQGLALADVCEVYGVRTVGVSSASVSQAADRRGGPAGHAHGAHDTHAMHDPGGAGDMPGMAMPAAPMPADHTPASHRSDHCTLTGIGVFALGHHPFDGLLAAVAAVLQVALPRASVDAATLDASARWLALQLHSPPP